MSVEARAAFFDGVAGQWDGWHDLAALGAALDAGLAELGVAPGETVVDVGCGTGNLTAALARALGREGRVVALDVSRGMLEVARAKVADARVRWHVAGADALPVPDGAADRVFFLAVWPHLERPDAVAREALRALRPGGRVHVWHLMSRAQVNAIHTAGGEAVRSDLLAPASETAAVLARAGLEVLRAEEDGARYLVTAARPAAARGEEERRPPRGAGAGR